MFRMVREDLYVFMYIIYYVYYMFIIFMYIYIVVYIFEIDCVLFILGFLEFNYIKSLEYMDSND